LVYLYGSCERRSAYPVLADPAPLRLRDRFTNRTIIAQEQDLRALVEITAANELDVVRHNPAMAAEHGAGLLELFTRVRERLSPAAWRDCLAVLAQHGPRPHHAPAPGIAISGLDHLVLTVTDLDQTIDFYQRVLCMRPVIFGGGRRALAFGPSKINLHQAGREIDPHAASPTPGSADLCLITTTPLEQVLAYLAAQGVTVEEGPVPRTGARGPIMSVYIRDPDDNLIEIASYHTPRRRGDPGPTSGDPGMPRISYDDAAASAFRASRHLPRDGLAEWRDAVARHLAPRPGMRLLDLGAGTGMWAAAFTDWFGIEVVAVEPCSAMRARSSYPAMLAGDATSIPLDAGSVDGAWLSTVIHHLPDLPAAAAELRRVLLPGGPVLIRSAFPGRHRQITLFRFFPEAVRVLDTYPSVADVRAAFATAGFELAVVEPVRQTTANSLATAAAHLRRDAHTPLRLITDAEYERGLARLRAAAETETGPVIDTLDLLILG
jgi:catechol 2,3-dioxygenase-like lactoylglutathione lyase family enzyme/ubiquinone/menaquinone biosynthesis C-methylase UbiE